MLSEIRMKKGRQESYDQQSKNYSSRRPWIKSYVFTRIVTLVSSLLSCFENKSCVMLNVGCGTGLLEKALPLKSKKLYYIGVDIAPNMARATKLYASDVVVADGELLPFRPNSFDVILSSRTIKYLNYFKFIAEVKRTLKSRGILALIFDSGDALWIRLIETIWGRTTDGGIYKTSLRTPHLSSLLSKLDFELTSVHPITLLPLMLFNHISPPLSEFLRHLDKPVKQGRITIVFARAAGFSKNTSATFFKSSSCNR